MAGLGVVGGFSDRISVNTECMRVVQVALDGELQYLPVGTSFVVFGDL
jgi:hypothetical protein